MSTKRRLTLLGFAAAMGLGVLAAGAPASADPPGHAKAWGWRKKQSSYDRQDWGRSRSRDYDRRYDHYDRRDSGRYSRRGDWRHSGRDIDGDGIPNDRDRDIDGDGHPNWRDDKPYGSGFDYSSRSRYRDRRRR